MRDPYAADAERAGRFGRLFKRFTRRWRIWMRRRPWLRSVYRVLLGIIGGLVIFAGVLMLVLPGPGWLTIFAGLAILGTEFRWARRLLGWLRQKLARLWERWQMYRAARAVAREERRRRAAA